MQQQYQEIISACGNTAIVGCNMNCEIKTHKQMTIEYTRTLLAKNGPYVHYFIAIMLNIPTIASHLYNCTVLAIKSYITENNLMNKMENV